MAAGRFAPSPTGPLHLGSLVAAVGSWLFARKSGAAWLLRMEDLDTPRVVPGAADEILFALERYGLEWDGSVVFQSQRTALYDEALDALRRKGALFDCACSRSELQRAASAPSGRDATEREGPVYPGTCRSGLPPGRAARAIRFRVPEGLVTFEDAVFGRVPEDTAEEVGDFVVKRADGPYAYQLAVVVDDADQGVTEVVRGADLLDSTARQILLLDALAHQAPAYAHLPLVMTADGVKLGKRDGALPLPSLDPRRVRESLGLALRILGQEPADGAPREMLTAALSRFDASRIPTRPVRLGAGSSPLDFL